MTKKLRSICQLLPVLRRVKRGGRCSLILKLVALSLTSSGCATLALFPKPPTTSLCSFDNVSKDDRSDKSPNFKCLGDLEKRFIIQWNSPSANGMMCTPYADYLEQNAYMKKVFDVIEKELIQKTQRK